MLSSIKLSRTAPLVLGTLESDGHNLSFGQQQMIKSYIPFMIIVTRLP